MAERRHVTVYHPDTGAKGDWWPDEEPMPGGYSLVPPIFPHMKPSTLKGIPGLSANFLEEIRRPKALMIIAGAIGLFFFRKPLLKILKTSGTSIKKIGRGVGKK